MHRENIHKPMAYPQTLSAPYSGFFHSGYNTDAASASMSAGAYTAGAQGMGQKCISCRPTSPGSSAPATASETYTFLAVKHTPGHCTSGKQNTFWRPCIACLLAAHRAGRRSKAVRLHNCMAAIPEGRCTAFPPGLHP